MATSSWFPYFLVVVFLLSAPSSCSAFNITALLEKNPEFSTFNSLLTQTGVAADVNSRRTITVLALDNGAAGGLSGRPAAVIKSIVSVHVALDYYDMAKFKNMTKKSIVITTLFQSSGLAANQSGYLNVTRDPSGDCRIRSAEPGSSFVSDIVKEVVAEPYNISVLQVSGVIIPEGIDSINNTVATPPPAHAPKAATPSPAEAPSDPKKNKTSPASAPAPAANDVAPAPSDDNKAPADAPPTDAPAPASGPAAADGPGDADAPSPGADDDGGSDKSSASREVASSFMGAVAAVLICMAAAL